MVNCSERLRSRSKFDLKLDGSHGLHFNYPRFMKICSFYFEGLIALYKILNKLNDKILYSVGLTKQALKLCTLLAKPHTHFCYFVAKISTLYP